MSTKMLVDGNFMNEDEWRWYDVAASQYRTSSTGYVPQGCLYRDRIFSTCIKKQCIHDVVIVIY